MSIVENAKVCSEGPALQSGHVIHCTQPSAASEKPDHGSHDFTGDHDAAVAEPFGGHHLGPIPGRRHGQSLGHRDLFIALIVDHEGSGSQPGYDSGDVHMFEWFAHLLLNHSDERGNILFCKPS